MKLTILVVFNVVKFVTALPFKEACGYESCNKVDPNKINIHLVPHSHDDVGWLKTVDQYYFGAKNYIQSANVEQIIGSVIQALQKDKRRRFIQVETAFFWQWWQKQSFETQETTRNLVNSGRLEITNGAWSMNDEAATHYHSIIDQFTWGLRIINDTLGKCGRPKIGWQIDPFGHSVEMANIFSQMGYDGVFLGRIDYRDQKKRRQNKELEMIWRTSERSDNSSEIFTGILYDLYVTPSEMCWDVACDDTPIVDDEESPEYNADKIVNKFYNYVLKVLKTYKTNNVLITMGGDFHYQAAEMIFSNMDRLISSFQKSKPDVNIIYSTPSCYLKAVNDEVKYKEQQLPLKTDDFFPYASMPHRYWTGYFTSRPNIKHLERQGNNLLQVMKQTTSFAKYTSSLNLEKNLTHLKEAMGIMQHHDAITGTEKQHVANDYVRILTSAMKTAENGVGDIITNLLKKNDTADVEDVSMEFASCLLSNVSHCAQSNLDRFAVVVYNPLSWYTNYYVRLPVNESSYVITGPDGNVNYEILPTMTDFSYVYSIKPSKYEIVFTAENLPPLGLKYFYVERSWENVNKLPNVVEETDHFGNENTGFSIDKETGLLSSVTLNGTTIEVNQTFMYYNGASSGDEQKNYQASGAYVFLPAIDTAIAVPLSGNVSYDTYRSDLVDEVHQRFNNWTRQIIRVYKNENFIEFDWLVGPIELFKSLGVEVISRFATNLSNNGVFYTDSNGRQMVKRIRNFRETYEYTNEEPVSGNYYPVTSSIAIKDGGAENLEFTILNDRSQGGSSLEDGQIELMVHRRLLEDDGLGVSEALNEYEFDVGVVARGQHYLTFAKSNRAAVDRRLLVQKKLLSPWVFIGNAISESHCLKNLQAKLNFKFSGLTNPLPENIQILTLEPWTDNSILLRLEHIFEKNEANSLSLPVTINLKNLFTLFDILSMEEMNLAANVPKSEMNRMSWNAQENVKCEERKRTDFTDITLKPMEIRTFIVQIKSKI